MGYAPNQSQTCHFAWGGKGSGAALPGQEEGRGQASRWAVLTLPLYGFEMAPGMGVEWRGAWGGAKRRGRTASSSAPGSPLAGLAVPPASGSRAKGEPSLPGELLPVSVDKTKGPVVASVPARMRSQCRLQVREQHAALLCQRQQASCGYPLVPGASVLAGIQWSAP